MPLGMGGVVLHELRRVGRVGGVGIGVRRRRGSELSMESGGRLGDGRWLGCGLGLADSFYISCGGGGGVLRGVSGCYRGG